MNYSYPNGSDWKQLSGKEYLLDQCSIRDNGPGRLPKCLREEINQNNSGKHVNHEVRLFVEAKEDTKGKVEDYELNRRLDVAPQQSENGASVAYLQLLPHN